jgi:hypothetical protein
VRRFFAAEGLRASMRRMRFSASWKLLQRGRRGPGGDRGRGVSDRPHSMRYDEANLGYYAEGTTTGAVRPARHRALARCEGDTTTLICPDRMVGGKQ